MLPASDAVVAALRARMAALMGYPEEALEPLQGVRYTPATEGRPGQYYKPHHDFYNACETWMEGNRHFTFLVCNPTPTLTPTPDPNPDPYQVYLNRVEGGGGQTGFPQLNLTVETTPYAALLFNNCLDNGTP